MCLADKHIKMEVALSLLLSVLLCFVHQQPQALALASPFSHGMCKLKPFILKSCYAL